MEYKVVMNDGSTLHGDKIFEQNGMTSIVKFRKPSGISYWLNKLMGKDMKEVKDVCNVPSTEIGQRHILGITDDDLQVFEAIAAERKNAKAKTQTQTVSEIMYN